MWPISFLLVVTKAGGDEEERGRDCCWRDSCGCCSNSPFMWSGCHTDIFKQKQTPIKVFTLSLSSSCYPSQLTVWTFDWSAWNLIEGSSNHLFLKDPSIPICFLSALYQMETWNKCVNLKNLWCVPSAGARSDSADHCFHIFNVLSQGCTSVRTTTRCQSVFAAWASGSRMTWWSNKIGPLSSFPAMHPRP